MKLDKLNSLSPPYVPYTYYQNFSYSKTKSLCVPCTDQRCEDNQFWESSSAELVIDSMTYTTTIICGDIDNMNSDKSGCFLGGSNLTFYEDHMCYFAQVGNECDYITQQVGEQEVFTIDNATLTITMSDSSQQ